MNPVHATPVPWRSNLQHPRYGTDETYRLAAAWLETCEVVADWGGSTGYFGTLLRPEVSYLNVDGTRQVPGQIVADLTAYHERCDGLLLRHVLEHVQDWPTVLGNALQAFRTRMVLVTFTPPVANTRIVKMKSGWPVRYFNPDLLRIFMGPLLVGDEAIQTSHPEHIYYLERR